MPIRKTVFLFILSVPFALLAPVSTFAGTSAYSNVSVLYNPSTGDHLYTSSENERIATSCSSPSQYVAEEPSPAFYLNVSDAIFSALVFRLYNQATQRHFYTTSVAERDISLNAGFRLEKSSDVYNVYADISQQTGDRAVYRLYQPYTGIHLYTTSQAEVTNATYALGNTAQTIYVNEGIAFYAPPNSSTTPTPSMWRMRNTVTGDYFFASDQEKGAVGCSHPTYALEKSPFVEYTSQITPNSFPIFRYFNPSTKIHFYSSSSSEGVSAMQSGYLSEGVAFFVEPSAGNFAVYRLRKPNGGYYFSTDNNLSITGHLGEYLYEGVAFSTGVAS